MNTDDDFLVEDHIYDFRQAMESALYHAVQDSDERYTICTRIADALEKLIEAKMRTRK